MFLRCHLGLRGVEIKHTPSPASGTSSSVQVNKLNIAAQVISATKEVRMKSGRSVKEAVTTLGRVGGPAVPVLVRVSSSPVDRLESGFRG